MTRNHASRSAIGAALAFLSALALWKTPVGNSLINTSYDHCVQFSSRSVTNKITFVMMDNESFDAMHQTRGQPWDRDLHAQLLNKLADDGCAMVVVDAFFGQRREEQKDDALAGAMQRHRKIVLMAEQALAAHPEISSARPLVPNDLFNVASRTNWGVAWLDPDADGIVRRHWPFPAPGPYPSLAESAAKVFGAKLDRSPQERWLRYYGQEPPWRHLSYSVALNQPPEFFHDQIVFIGLQPKTSVADNEPDEFQTPHTRWTGESCAGSEIMITTFVNLLKNESLQRSKPLEASALIVGALLFGAGLPRMRLGRAIVGGVVGVAIVFGGSIALMSATNFWFPYLLIVAGQIPVALVWSDITSRVNRGAEAKERTEIGRVEDVYDIPGYRLVQPPFGRGAYGKVWLARSDAGEWRAVKVVSLDRFDNDSAPYNREFEGVSRYLEICDKHPGLLRVTFVSEKFPTHFYYVMELADALEPGWENFPGAYKPRDLNRECALAAQKRLSIAQCLEIGLALTETLDFIHRAGLAHRDIKPQNILFVDEQPKLADLGLLTCIRPPEAERTAVGTPGYMPPAPEMPGTPQADIYALGMVLYVISTGQSPALFPDFSATALQRNDATKFFDLNSIVLTACQPNPADRFQSAREMHCELERVRSK
jgi:CHASE2 domain-containing sensor protein